MEGRKEGNILFNDAFNTFYFTVIWKEGRKEMCYLMMHSTHFILRLYGKKEGNVLFNDAFNTFYFMSYMEGRKEGNILFNDALNTFYFTVIWKEGRKCFIQ